MGTGTQKQTYRQSLCYGVNCVPGKYNGFYKLHPVYAYTFEIKRKDILFKFIKAQLSKRLGLAIVITLRRSCERREFSSAEIEQFLQICRTDFDELWRTQFNNSLCHSIDFYNTFFILAFCNDPLLLISANYFVI